MAKHPVPKKKVSQSRTAKRYAAFARKKMVKLNGFVNIMTCPSCGNPKLNQKVCSACGMYRGKSIKAAAAATPVKKVKA